MIPQDSIPRRNVPSICEEAHIFDERVKPRGCEPVSARGTMTENFVTFNDTIRLQIALRPQPDAIGKARIRLGDSSACVQVLIT